MREVSQEFIDGKCIKYNLSDLVLKNIRIINKQIHEIYQNIEEDDRLYSKTNKELTDKEISVLFQHAKAAYQITNIITAVRFNMTNPPKKVGQYQVEAVNSHDSRFL